MGTWVDDSSIDNWGCSTDVADFIKPAVTSLVQSFVIGCLY